jgi:hypothetical protein
VVPPFCPTCNVSLSAIGGSSGLAIELKYGDLYQNYQNEGGVKGNRCWIDQAAGSEYILPRRQAWNMESMKSKAVQMHEILAHQEAGQLNHLYDSLHGEVQEAALMYSNWPKEALKETSTHVPYPT